MARTHLARQLARLARSSRSARGSAPGVRAGGEVEIRSQSRAQSALAAPSVAPVSRVVPEVTTDLYGAVSVVSSAATEEAETVQRQEQEYLGNQAAVYRNVDGQRFEDGRYKAFAEEISGFIPKSRQYTDPVRTFAYGTDASFYRLNPKLVVKVHNEAEVRQILPIARKHQVPVTFRAAGTSLSGQAITDSVLLKLSHTGPCFRNFTVHGDGSQITVEPGLIGGEVNRILAAHKKKHDHPVQYKIGPDPSSIDSCMMGGIIANNSSGMCCGVSQNTYHTVKDMKIVLLDGSVLDTADPASRASFLRTHKSLVDAVLDLASRVQADRGLTNLIRRKFAIKCTTGYSLNALVDFPLDDPIEIIKHLMIGSEGTLGFVSQATYNTVPEWPDKASAFILFPDVHAACRASAILRNESSVDAVELFDRASLRECGRDEAMTRLVPDINEADHRAASLLIECRGRNKKDLQDRIDEVHKVLRASGLPFGAQAIEPKSLDDYPFHHELKNYNVFWDVRKGLIPIVGGARETGTSMLIEDVACPVDNLADMMMDLIEMFESFGYADASCFGHALEGNLHLVFSQGFRDKDEVQRFSDLMDDMCYIVATKHGGSLKGEHGTGRNVAPFVEMEWGTKAYELMWELKELFDPEFILNPGVIMNDDPLVHTKFLKPSPAANALVDRCIECGFCESNCPSRDVTLTPRQRITVFREMNRLKRLDNPSNDEVARLDQLKGSYSYLGEETCAADGMCQVKCPVKINTGDLIKEIRAGQMKEWQRASGGAMWVANNFHLFNNTVPTLLNAVSLAHRVVGPTPLKLISSWMNKFTNNYVPTWNPYMPRGASPLRMPKPMEMDSPREKGIPRKVVYMPTCVTRMMGPSLSDSEKSSVHTKLMSLFEKANYEVIYPEGLSSSCCGMLFNTRGFKEAAASKVSNLEKALMEASEGGKIPIVLDTSPCLSQLKSQLTEQNLKFSLYEPVEFIRRFLADKLEFKKVRDVVAIHVPCSSKKMGIEQSFMDLAGRCASEVVSTNTPCCGMAGDRGMRFPELTAAATQHVNLPSSCTDGYSTSRTCEMALSDASGVNFRGLVYLVDEATVPKSQTHAAV